MELVGSIFIVLALLILVALFIARPFLQVARREENQLRGAAQQREHLRSSLLAERDRVLTALQELDFDFALGKVPEDEYPAMRAALLHKGADMLRQLDVLEAEQGGRAAAVAAEDRIEAAVASRRADSVYAAGRGEPLPEEMAAAGEHTGTNGHGKRSDELEDLIASRKRSRPESTGGFCPKCGKPVQKSDKFCSKCGYTL